MRNGKIGRSALLAAAAMGGLCLPAMTTAQEPRQAYSIEAVSLSEALTAVSRQSGVEVIFASDAVAGKRVRPLSGSYSAREAIDRLLLGTDLIAEYRDGGFVVRGRTQASVESTDGPAPSVDIVVTGSRIRAGENPSRSLSVSRNEIVNAGLPDLGGFIRTLPQNFNGGQNPTVFISSGANENATNSSTLNLRGLGQDATLTLINGHRVAYDAVSQGVDISSIPLIAVDRVDVVTDGSSAIYGSDAVGGVANVILLRDYEGASFSGRYGFATDGGFDQEQYSGIAGTRWNNGGFMVAADYLHWTAIKARQRSFATSFSPNDPILPSQKQFSAVMAAHQSLSEQVKFSVDAQYNHRRSSVTFSNSPPNDFQFNGQAVDRKVESFSVAPSIKVDIDQNWTATVAGMYGESRTHILNRAFFGNAEYQRTNLTYDNTAASAELGLEGAFARLPGGNARIAAGIGYRSNGLDLNSEITASGVTATSDRFDANRGVFFAYGEALVPVFGEGNAREAFHSLTLSAAIRYERYDSGQSIATPKFGFVYSPVADVTVKGSWGKSFKAQTIYQEFQQKNVALLSGAFIDGFSASQTFLYLFGGGDRLKPEKATTWSASLIYKPSFADGLRMEASYFDVRFRDRVTTPLTSIFAAISDPLNADLLTSSPSPSLQAALINASTFGLRNFTGAPYDPTNVGLVVDNRFRNASRESAKGVDLAVYYRLRAGADSSVNLRASASFLDSKRQRVVGARYVDLAGTIYDPPHWRATASADYDTKSANANFTLNYIGGVTDNRTSQPYRVSSFWSVDATLRLRALAAYGLLEGVEIILAAQNLFNEKPGKVRQMDPLDPSWDSTNHPSIGRTVSLTITKAF